MTKTEDYRATLRQMEDWEPFLLGESGLPGPRGNLELLQAVADEGNEDMFMRFVSFSPDIAPTNTPHEFLVACGAVGLGRLLAGGNTGVISTLRKLASDPRWRVREGVAMALQRLGDASKESLLQIADEWSRGSWLEQRAAGAGLCEPRLLREDWRTREVLRILDDVTASISGAEDRKSPDFKTLRQALGYCWSVAVAALPEEGKPLMEKWLASSDRDVSWIMRENLKKKRLSAMDEEWVRSLTGH